MKPDAYMPLYIGDWLKDTGHLDATCQGAYFLLCLHHWGKPGVPCSPDALMAITRVKPEDWARVGGLVSQFFKEENGMWINKRCIEEYAEIDRVYQAKVAGGKTRANELWGDRTHIPEKQDSYQNTNQDSLQQKHSSSTQSESESESSKKKSTSLAALAEIEAIYKAFPLHVGKPAAFRAIRGAISRGNPPASLLEKAKLFAASRGGDMSFCPHPSTWFNQDRFNDDPETWKPKQEQQAQHSQHSQPQSAFALTKIIEAKTTLANNLKNKHAVEGPLSTDWNSEAARQEYIKLRGEIKTVTAQLAKMA